MKAVSKSKFLTLAVIFIFFSHLAEAKQFVAYSLKEAEKRLKSGRIDREVTYLGGITHPIAVIYDEEKEDVILVGEVNGGGQQISLDDFVVAMRAILKHKTPPLVSIDRTNETAKTGKQKVRFEGGIENTKFGKDLLEADVILKKMGLGKLRTDIWGVKSYFDMSADEWEKTGKENEVTSRFWFVPSKEGSFVGVRRGVAIVDRLRITVKTEVMSANRVRDEIGERFAMMIASNFDDLSTYYAPLKRLDPLFRLTGLAEGINKWHSNFGISLPEAHFWLEEYKVSKVETPKEYPLKKNERTLERNGIRKKLTVDGGIKLEALILELQDKSIDALKEIVMKSRPDGSPLIWEVPLEAWGKPEIAESGEFKRHLRNLPISHKLGMSLNVRFSKPGRPLMSTSFQVSSTPLSESGKSYFNFTNSLTPPRLSPDVGGVMLQGVARIEGVEGAKVDLTQGNFSLIVDGKNARLAPETFRKFVTALWAVYFSDQDPGISIDPIAPGAKKHLVRYIGKVINTDLGRVMREADYLMKKWSVGTERPDFPWFKNPDDISAERGVIYIGAWSRFWFVPEDMTFKRSGDMLLFDRGRMRVKTEYMFKNEGIRADPANEEFARLLTEHYNKIAEKYPVYKELFEYAKLVSLAKYLKESGVPLFWFLMANKDLVLTEDSPGTVDALAKGSEHFKGVYIEGGVDLGVKGNYVYDTEAIKAIREVASKVSPAVTITSLKYQIASIEDAIARSVEGLSFDVGDKSYTVIPQHSLTSGKDRRGIRYQTDIAIRWKGFRFTQETLTQLRVLLFYKELSKRIGPETDLNELKPEFDNLYQESMEEAERITTRLKPLVGKSFNTEEGLVGALIELLGRKKAAELKPFVMKYAYSESNLEIVRFYNPMLQDSGEFGRGWRLLIPYRIEPEGDRKREFMNVFVPEKMAIVNLLTGEREILAFSDDRYSIVGYVPDRLEDSQFIGLFLLTDGSFRLVDKLGNEFQFDQAGYLTDMIFSENYHIHIDYTYSFTDAFEKPPYRVEPADNERIWFLNAMIPRRMKVIDLINGESEILVFSDKEKIVGYVPENKENSKFQILAILTDASFRLLDKEGKEVAFNPAGEFEAMGVSGYPLVKSISQGKYKVDFKYIIDNKGRLIIASAYLRAENEEKSIYMVNYQYDTDGRLVSVKTSLNKLAGLYNY